jgi:hypothetical protein
LVPRADRRRRRRLNAVACMGTVQHSEDRPSLLPRLWGNVPQRGPLPLLLFMHPVMTTRSINRSLHLLRFRGGFSICVIHWLVGWGSKKEDNRQHGTLLTYLFACPPLLPLFAGTGDPKKPQTWELVGVGQVMGMDSYGSSSHFFEHNRPRLLNSKSQTS